MPKKPGTRIFLTAIAIVLTFTVNFSYGLTAKEAEVWGKDIDIYAGKISEFHIDPFHSLPKENFYNKITSIKKSLPEKNEEEVMVELMRLTHSINDGHTSFPVWGRTLNTLPFSVRIFNNEAYIVKTTAQYKSLLGARLISVNQVSSETIMKSVKDITPFTENPYSSAVRVAEYMTKAEVLVGLGFLANVETTPVEFEIGGKRKVLQLEPAKNLKIDQSYSVNADSLFPKVKQVNDDLWFGSLEDRKSVYLRFHRYTSIKNMESFADDLLSFINKNQSENLIIDLRDNYGGDFFVGLRLAQQLVLADSIYWKSGVYVLINNITFSAAMSNAAQFQQLLNAKLVGEPTGARPSGYQDMGSFTLPNSKLDVTWSKRLYRFNDTQKDALYPDVSIPFTLQDYLDRKDPQLLWILNDIASH
jgi:hypothetical protein